MALKESGSQGSHHSEEIVSRSERFIEKYSKTIIWCVLGVIVLGVGIWLYIDKVVKPRGDKAAAELYLAEEQFMAGADSAALNAPATGAIGLLAIADKYSSTDAGKLLTPTLVSSTTTRASTRRLSVSSKSSRLRRR